jgi:conjugative relaxase-like TrwC/TraI family protein
MLRIVQSRNAAAARLYFDQALARGDGYYFADKNEQEVVGNWFGKDAERLGLKGPVQRDDFHALVEGKDPQTRESLSQRMREDRRPGYDFNFHASKSVSLVYELTRDERIRHAFEASVRETMTEIEKDMATRDQSGGRNDKVKTGGLVAAEFTHFTSRPAKEDGKPDPQLHMHVFVMNLTHDERRGGWFAPEFHDLHLDRPYHQAAFHKRFASRLMDLGYAVERTEDAFEIHGIKRATIDKFSRRTREVEDEARRKGIQDEAEKAKLGAKTRRKKDKDLTRGELRAYWRDRLDPEERQDVKAIVMRASRGSVSGGPDTPSPGESIDFARDHLFERKSAVSEKAFLAAALHHGVANPETTPEGLTRQVRARSDLLRGTVKGERWLSTKEVYAEEQRMIAFARDGVNTCRPFQDGPIDVAPVTDKGKTIILGPEQQEAVRRVVASTDRVQVLIGKAGVGKSTSLQEIARHIRADDRTILALAPSSTARDELRNKGFDAHNVQRLLVDTKLQDRVDHHTVLLVDEAGMLSSRDLARISSLAEEKGARLLLVGDPGQHKSVERGDALRLVEQQAGLTPARLTRIVRQEKAAYRTAVEQVSRGNVTTGFHMLDEMRSIREIDAEERHLHLAADYLQARDDGKTALVVSPTHAEKDRVTGIIRAELKARGDIHGEEHTVTSLKAKGWTRAERGLAGNFATGDVVEFHLHGKGPFKKGSRWTVAGRDDQGQVLVRDAAGKQAALPLHHADRYEVYGARTLDVARGDIIRLTKGGRSADKHRIDVKNNDLFTIAGFTARGDIVTTQGRVIDQHYFHLEHGFVRTSHSSQGSTVDRVIIAQGSESFGASSREQFYVSISRGKESCMIYTDDKKGLLRAVQRSGERLSATELIGRQDADRERRKRWHELRTITLANQAAGSAWRTARKAARKARDTARSWVDRVRDPDNHPPHPPRRPSHAR